jgi:hypothetical protein
MSITELSPPLHSEKTHQPVDVPGYVSAVLDPYLTYNDGLTYNDREVSRCAQEMKTSITEDVNNGLLIGLTPEFVDERTGERDQIPVGRYVESFAMGHYPISAPPSDIFVHDVSVHLNGWRKVARDKELSEGLSKVAGHLVNTLKASGKPLSHPENERLRSRFIYFADVMDRSTITEEYTVGLYANIVWPMDRWLRDQI